MTRFAKQAISCSTRDDLQPSRIELRNLDMGMQGGDGGSGRVRSSAGRGSDKTTSFGQIVTGGGVGKKI